MGPCPRPVSHGTRRRGPCPGGERPPVAIGTVTGALGSAEATVPERRSGQAAYLENHHTRTRTAEPRAALGPPASDGGLSCPRPGLPFDLGEKQTRQARWLPRSPRCWAPHHRHPHRSLNKHHDRFSSPFISGGNSGVRPRGEQAAGVGGSGGGRPPAALGLQPLPPPVPDSTPTHRRRSCRRSQKPGAAGLV